MKLIDALARIERWGSENSKATQKLKDATGLVAAELLSRLLKEATVEDWQPRLVEDHYLQPLGPDSERVLALDGNGKVRLVAERAGASWHVKLVSEEEILAYARVWDAGHVTPPGTAPGLEDRQGFPTAMSREAALDFADVVANGLLDRIAERLHTQTETAVRAQAKLAAKPAAKV